MNLYIKTHSCTALLILALLYSTTSPISAQVTSLELTASPSNAIEFAVNFTQNMGQSWSVVPSQSNIHVSPNAGSGNGIFTITVTPGPSGIVTVTTPGASNSPQQIQINVAAVPPSTPFGSFDSPPDNLAVVGAVAVTGWALDNTEVTKVDIWREVPSGLAYIGDAVFVPGARPDVEKTFPNIPFNTRAGWGYSLLTNMLPNSNGSGALGNGTFKLHAIAHNMSGTQFDLGTKTITVDNAHASKPFGTIDTPAQGETVSGASYVNFGWALTQNPYVIPKDGSTITVFVDGVSSGHPTYNQYRNDIATLFPGLGNSSGAIGFFYIDTTKLTNGLHTISWAASDNANRNEGLGSRYFTVANPGSGGANFPQEQSSIARSGEVTLLKGYDSQGEAKAIIPDQTGTYSIDATELDRIELHVGAVKGFLAAGRHHRLFPIGSSLRAGVFYWQLGPGFMGVFPLVFERPDGTHVRVNVKVKPKTLEKRVG